LIWRSIGGVALLLVACSSEPPRSILPVSYATQFTRVRSCRKSADHDLDHVLIFADAVAAPAYQGRTDPFATGGIIVKEEHDLDDPDCTGPIVRWAVMQKLAPRSSPTTLDWRWQLIDDKGVVESQDEKGCISCHYDCGIPPEGYGGTCAAP
jgi:hypothetical protein